MYSDVIRVIAFSLIRGRIKVRNNSRTINYTFEMDPDTINWSQFLYTVEKLFMY